MEDEDANDPDVIAAHPPEKAVDPKLHFQVGENEGKWSEYDDRGVPTKNSKKRKPTKKEKDNLEAEFLDAKKKYQQYLKDVEEWQKQLVEAEASLEYSDKLRWAFRQIGPDKKSPIVIDELEDIFRIAGWDELSKREVGRIKKSAAEFADEENRLDLEALRKFTSLQMPVLLLEERLSGDAVNDLALADLYSPRTWRKKLEDAELVGGPKKEKKDKKGKKDAGRSSPRSPRGGGASARDGPSSPRGDRKKSRKDGESSPRSPRGGRERDMGGTATTLSAASPRGGKEKKDKKSKR
mmetsp:Transcript_79960/g.232149  ORF Transcript_79960/g.232149 Transcript_79960/m.232149 type:complete len:295 (-) Transcript_79960:105-989(-)